MSAADLLGLRDHLAECRARGMRGTLWREVRAYVAALAGERGTDERSVLEAQDQVERPVYAAKAVRS